MIGKYRYKWKSLGIIFLLAVLILGSSYKDVYGSNHQDYSADELLQIMEDIVIWKKNSLGISKDEMLFGNLFLKNAGDSSADWYPFAIGRMGYAEDYESYLAVIEQVVANRYQKEEKLSESKATEWHRISLAILSCGGDPTALTGTDGSPINLVADGTYNRVEGESMGIQGLNGWIWGLILLDSMRYRIPETGTVSRDGIIMEILSYQNTDGGFSLKGGTDTDVDITAMAIQALAPYYNSEQQYTYQNRVTKNEECKKVRDAIEQALEILSVLQLEDGDFNSWGTDNLESTAQVLVALCCLNINPLMDERFQKGESTLLDGIMKYRQADGGFIHSKIYDEENPGSNPDESNSMASEQALYALTAFCRYQSGMRSLYDFRMEMNQELKERIRKVEEEIEHMDGKEQAVRQAFEAYKQIPAEERCYVKNYKTLAEAMESAGIPNDSEYLSSAMEQNSGGNGAITSLNSQLFTMEGTTVFTAEHEAEALRLLEQEGTTEHNVLVIQLIHKLDNADNRQQYLYLYDKLLQKKREIEQIQQEIEALNRDILDWLYPFETLGIGDWNHIKEIEKRYGKLSDYDKTRILHYEDVEKSYTQVSGRIRALIIGGLMGIVIIIVLLVVIRRMKMRRLERKRMNMEDIPEEWEEDDME